MSEFQATLRDSGAFAAILEFLAHELTRDHICLDVLPEGLEIHGTDEAQTIYLSVFLPAGQCTRQRARSPLLDLEACWWVAQAAGSFISYRAERHFLRVAVKPLLLRAAIKKGAASVSIEVPSAGSDFVQVGSPICDSFPGHAAEMDEAAQQVISTGGSAQQGGLQKVTTQRISTLDLQQAAEEIRASSEPRIGGGVGSS